MNPFILGIDIGTGSTKAVAVSLVGEPLLVNQAYYPIHSTELGFSEQDPDLIWQAFLKCAEEVIKELNEPLAICFSSAMHSLIAVDKHCKPLRMMMTWADARSEELVTEVLESPFAEDLYNNTGTPLHPMSPLFKIIWIRKNQPEVFSQTFKFISIKEYIWYKLFNEYQVDYSIASATGLFNIDTFTWNPQSLHLAGITSAKLSELVNTTYSKKGVDLNSNFFNISHKTLFVIGASDGCLANLGSFASEPDTAALTIGTSGAVRVASKRPIRNFKAMLFNYLLDEETYICGGAINNGGNALQWFMKNFLSDDHENYIDFFKDISLVRPGSEGLIFLPYLYGERAPIWDVKSSSCFIGIRSHHTRKHFARAVLEGICFALKDILLMVEEASGSINQLNVSGGIVLSETWQQILADITGKRICVVQSEDASAVGAAFLAMKALHLVDTYSAISKGKHQSLIKPSDNSAIYQQYFSIYRPLYDTLKESMHQLYYLNQN